MRELGLALLALRPLGLAPLALTLMSATEGGGGPSTDGLLLESGDYVLLESGDYLLME